MRDVFYQGGQNCVLINFWFFCIFKKRQIKFLILIINNQFSINLIYWTYESFVPNSCIPYWSLNFWINWFESTYSSKQFNSILIITATFMLESASFRGKLFQLLPVSIPIFFKCNKETFLIWQKQSVELFKGSNLIFHATMQEGIWNKF